MFSHVEVFFNLLWVFVLLIGAVILIWILKKRDPHDDGPLLEEIEEVEEP
ncbi:MAG: hypothetical protein ACXVC1_04840 [Tumebacillaceae bacterium]